MTATEQRPVVTDVSRGKSIEQRRMALGLPSLVKFAEASGFNRETLSKVENGTASERMMANVEAWLDKMEAGTTVAYSSQTGAVQVKLRNVFGVGDAEVIFDGNTPPEEMAAKMKAILEALKPDSA